MWNARLSALALAGLGSLSILMPPSTAAEEIFLAETFAGSPYARGWQSYGATNLFVWNAANGHLEVTWDSRQTNSFFYHPLGIALTRTNDFMLGFDLRLADITVGIDPTKPFTFQIAIGLIDLASATNAGFLRGTGFNSPNLVELDYFPDSGYGATIAPTIISSNNEFSAGGFTFPLELTTNDLFHVELRYVATNQTLRTWMTRNGQRFGPINNAFLAPGFSDFQVDQIAISSYSDAGQDPMYAGSVLAHGTVDNVVFVCPPPVAEVAGGFLGQNWQVRFASHTNWVYSLERTGDLTNWTTVSAPAAGTGGELALQETNGPVAKAFYRVRAQRP